MNWEDFVYFFQKSDQWNDVSKCLRESNVLSLGGAEGNLCLKTTNPEDRAVGIHYNLTSSRQDVIGIFGAGLRPTTGDVGVYVAFQAF